MIDKKDKEILNSIQTDFPIDPRPYRIIAEKLDLSEDELIGRINRMKDKMIIRRIGGNFSPEKIGYRSTLCAAKVDEDKMDAFVRTVNSYPGVTHNYKRDHKLNIWFTFIAPSSEIIKKNLEKISKKTGVNILNIPATRIFKISANFRL